MTAYWGLVHEEDAAFGISFPDVPGCVSAGSTLETVLTEGREALSSHLAWLKAERDPIPEPRSYAALMSDPEIAAEAEGATWHQIRTRVVAAPKLRVNVMIDPGLLREADEAAAAEGTTRSGLIEAALRDRFAPHEHLAGAAGPGREPASGKISGRTAADVAIKRRRAMPAGRSSA